MKTTGKTFEAFLWDVTDVEDQCDTMQRVAKARLPFSRVFSADGADTIVIVCCAVKFTKKEAVTYLRDELDLELPAGAV